MSLPNFLSLALAFGAVLGGAAAVGQLWLAVERWREEKAEREKPNGDEGTKGGYDLGA